MMDTFLLSILVGALIGWFLLTLIRWHNNR